MPTSIYLGNAKPVTTYGGAHAVTHRDGEAPLFESNVTDDQHPALKVATPEGERDRAFVAVQDLSHLGPQITTFVREANVPEGASRDDEVANHVYAVKALWPLQSSEAPMWVASSDQDVAAAIAAEFACPVLPADLGALAAEQREEWERISERIEGPQALMVNGGRDATFDLIFSTGGYTYIGLTATATAPSASDTSLTGQITTASGGLVAASATYAHTSGTGGTFHSRTLLSSTATLSASGDALTVTWTFTLTPS